MKKIYIYETPKSKEDGYVKIGETSRDVETRIKEQFQTAAIYNEEETEFTILHQREAKKENGCEYTDKDFHKFLLSKGVSKPNKNKEWFEITIEQAISALNAFEKDNFNHDIKRIYDFKMRKEQQRAVDLAYNYFTKNSQFKDNIKNDFLWNAKMRFGKTFASYQLMKKFNWTKILIITYRPAVKKSWRDDLNSHVDFIGYNFLSDEYISNFDKKNKNVVFISFQDLLKADVNKSIMKDKHKIIFETEWDCVFIDEFHYGTSTSNALGIIDGYNDEDSEIIKKSIEQDEMKEREKELQEEFDVIENLLNDKYLKTKNRLFLSGTPFKAIKNNRFSSEQIFNWTYLDEQREKNKWINNNSDEYKKNKESNPYHSLPKLNLYIYEISDENYKKGIDKQKNEFSLSYFFKAEKNIFVNENNVKKWLDIIAGKVTYANNDNDFEENSLSHYEKSKFPFANIESNGFSHILNHTLWLLPSVASCKAMEKILKEHNVFSNYKIIVAAGKGFGVGANAIPPVEQAISKNRKTITLSCGKLTEGVSIKEWTGVLFLTDIASPERYFQTAFRAQTPWKENGITKKEDCYIFDFHPSRSLNLLSEYSNKLNKKEDRKELAKLTEQKENLIEFLKYLPVLKISGNSMMSLDANAVMSFDCSNYNSSDLIKAFQSNKNINISKEQISDIMADVDILKRCDHILDNIKAYRKYMGKEEEAPSIKEIGDINKKLDKLKTKKLKEKYKDKKINKAIDSHEKEIKAKQDQMRELLKILLGRIPLFMYLTHALEEDLHEVLYSTQSEKDGLFRKATGIEVEDFEFLVNQGLIKSTSINSYIQRFKEIEILNNESDNILF